MKRPSSDGITRNREVLVYENDFLTLYDDEVSFPGGSQGRYLRACWRAPYSVAVLPITPHGEYVLIRQYSYAQENWILQLPKGMGRQGVTPLDMARQELREETGFESSDWTLIQTTYVDPGFIANPTHLFRAQYAVHNGPPQWEESEIISDIVLVHPDEARNSAWLQSIQDTITLMALLGDLQGKES